jgi:hypothetical protein
MAAEKTTPMLKITDVGGFLTYDNNGEETAVGYLIIGPHNKVYDASIGAIPVIPEVATKHNELLDQALLAGLDQSSKIGQGHYFYVKRSTGSFSVTTWLGTKLAEHISVVARTPKTLTLRFSRGAHTYEGVWDKTHDGDDFFFTRVS